MYDGDLRNQKSPFFLLFFMNYFQFLEIKEKQLLGFILTLFITNLATQMKAKNNLFL